MAFKGRVLLSYASPLFNPNNDANRWQAAYDANKAAVDFALAQGHALHPRLIRSGCRSVTRRVIMVNQFQYPNHANNFNGIRPEPLTKRRFQQQPAYPVAVAGVSQRDGSPMQFDKDQLTDPVYNAQFLTDFYTNPATTAFSRPFSAAAHLIPLPMKWRPST